MQEFFVALVHARRYVLRLPYLIAVDRATVEGFEDEHSEAVRVDHRHRMTFDSIPTTLRNLGGGITSRIG